MREVASQRSAAILNRVTLCTQLMARGYKVGMNMFVPFCNWIDGLDWIYGFPVSLFLWLGFPDLISDLEEKIQLREVIEITVGVS